MKYTIFRTGYYTVSTTHYTEQHTTSLALKPNPDYKWWKFWSKELSLIIKVQNRTIDVPMAGTQVRFLRKGNTVESDICVFVR